MRGLCERAPRILRMGAVMLIGLAMLLQGALARSLNIEILPVGYVLSPDEVIDTLGRDVIRPGVANQSACAITLPDMEAAVSRRDDPVALLLSNAPEVLDDRVLPRGRGILAAADVPAGKVRLLVSHTNAYPLAEDYVLRMHNPGEEIADVVLDARATARQNPIAGAFAADTTVGGALVRTFLDLERNGPAVGWRVVDGDRRRLIRTGQSSETRLITQVRGLGMAWLTLTTSVPLHLEVCAVPSGGEIGSAPVVSRSGSQVRGLFQKPDTSIEAVVDVTEGTPTRLVFGGAQRDNPKGKLDTGTYMTGTDTTGTSADPQTNRGDYGGITHLRITVKGTPQNHCVGATFVLVAGGRKAALLPVKDGKPVTVAQWGGLVLGRARSGETFTYDFSLPPNSWAPIYLLAIPAHHI